MLERRDSSRGAHPVMRPYSIYWDFSLSRLLLRFREALRDATNRPAGPITGTR
jgi:hypothetical protein